jgi:uncharacterized membrane protein YdbT with pleckstrin-like domain
MSKEMMVFGPDIKYLRKRQLLSLIWFLIALIIVVGIFLGFMFGAGETTTAFIILGAASGGVLLWYILWLVFLYYYFKSMSYRLKENEMIVNRGVFNKIEKNVPFRAVTNLAIYRSLFDRFFGIGTIRLHTAGYSGTPLPEENIEGLVNFQDIYDKLIAKIRPLRAMTPKASIEIDEEDDQYQINLKILETLKEIKEILLEEQK